MRPPSPLIRLLILTGQREREVADATWSEFNLPGRLWIIPAARIEEEIDARIEEAVARRDMTPEPPAGTTEPKPAPVIADRSTAQQRRAEKAPPKKAGAGRPN